MILADTSIWIDHINRGRNEELLYLLDGQSVVTHDFIIGEIAMGSLKKRRAQLAFLRDLHRIPTASEPEVSLLIETANLHGTGLGYVDAHLLTAARAAEDGEIRVWTRDKRLHAQAERLEVAYFT